MHQATSNPREAAFLAVLASLRDESYVNDSLDQWCQDVTPPQVDADLARMIGCGATRMGLALDAIAKQLSDKKNLKVKVREKALLRCALYQLCYLNRLPAYAVIDESVELAKKYCHTTFANFLNAILRRYVDEPPELPQGDTVPEMSARYSYPPFFVEAIVQSEGVEKAKEVMEAGNQPPKTMVRIRKKGETPPGVELIRAISTPVGVVKERSALAKLILSPDVYIQNVTPVLLIDALCHQLETPPKKILDLCSAPGGKLLALHDHYPDATLFANDSSEKRLQILKQNCEKYGLNPTITCHPGESYPTDQTFDLILLDVPCSNCGVLNKRPEARTRLADAPLTKLEELQLKLIEHATKLLAPNGQIWVLTCSILKRENGCLIDRACNDFQLEVLSRQTQLPTMEGYDGGYAAALAAI